MLQVNIPSMYIQNRVKTRDKSQRSMTPAPDLYSVSKKVACYLTFFLIEKRKGSNFDRKYCTCLSKLFIYDVVSHSISVHP